MFFAHSSWQPNVELTSVRPSLNSSPKLLNWILLNLFPKLLQQTSDEFLLVMELYNLRRNTLQYKILVQTIQISLTETYSFHLKRSSIRRTFIEIQKKNLFYSSCEYSVWINPWLNMYESWELNFDINSHSKVHTLTPLPLRCYANKTQQPTFINFMTNTYRKYDIISQSTGFYCIITRIKHKLKAFTNVPPHADE